MHAPEVSPSKVGRGLPRIVDFTLALVGLLLSAPLIAVAGILIKIESGGDVFFNQDRVGKDGKPFVYRKLRTMQADHAGPKVTAAADARITPVGRVLRNTKLDELPSLWHVVRGEMALVGPRPEVPYHVDLDDPLRRISLSVRPGITDPVTLALRNEEDLLQSVDGDVEEFYREHLVPYKLLGYRAFLSTRTWHGDVRLLLGTLWAVVAPSRTPAPRPDTIMATVTAAQQGHGSPK